MTARTWAHCAPGPTPQRRSRGDQSPVPSRSPPGPRGARGRDELGDTASPGTRQALVEAAATAASSGRSSPAVTSCRIPLTDTRAFRTGLPNLSTTMPLMPRCAWDRDEGTGVTGGGATAHPADPSKPPPARAAASSSGKRGRPGSPSLGPHSGSRSHPGLQVTMSPTRARVRLQPLKPPVGVCPRPLNTPCVSMPTAPPPRVSVPTALRAPGGQARPLHVPGGRPPPRLPDAARIPHENGGREQAQPPLLCGAEPGTTGHVCHAHLGAAPTPRPLPRGGPFLSHSETWLTLLFLQAALPDDHPFRGPSGAAPSWASTLPAPTSQGIAAALSPRPEGRGQARSRAPFTLGPRSGVRCPLPGQGRAVERWRAQPLPARGGGDAPPRPAQDHCKPVLNGPRQTRSLSDGQAGRSGGSPPGTPPSTARHRY